MECLQCGLTVGLGCACSPRRQGESGIRKRGGHRRTRQPSTHSRYRSFRELRSLFREGKLAWEDLDQAERDVLNPEQRRQLQDGESEVLRRDDRDIHGSASVWTRSGGLPTLGDRR